jgi:hypothetical protein
MLQSLFPLDLGRRARTIRRRKVLLLLRHRWLWLSLRRWLRRWLLRWLRCWLRWRRFTALPPLALEAQLRQQIVHAGTAPSAITLAEARRSSCANSSRRLRRLPRMQRHGGSRAHEGPARPRARTDSASHHQSACASGAQAAVTGAFRAG